MRIYEGSPRQDYEEVLRSIGAYLDGRGTREILLTEAPDGFIVQGLVIEEERGERSESMGQQTKETLTFLDEDIARFMDEALARRQGGAPQPDFRTAGYYERALRVLGRYVDQQRPRDVFLFEQDGAFVLRLLIAGQAGAHHVLAEFTRDEIESMIQQGPAWRNQPQPRSGGLFGRPTQEPRRSP
ncbi:MAG TPA: hypothetical protein VGQ47_02825 [Candidatus Limnocylindrales bacterium]|jgi:hypothetical protein|nr:hypothetical protein [Candidatus Limnocylindrales bacterium]